MEDFTLGDLNYATNKIKEELQCLVQLNMSRPGFYDAVVYMGELSEELVT